MNSMHLFPRGAKWWLGPALGCFLMLSGVSAQSPASETPSAVSTPAVVTEASPSTVASPMEHGRVLYPANAPQPASGPARSGSETASLPGLATSFVLLLALCAGGYYLVRRQSGFLPVGKGQRKLVVSESRSLGNRQFLVVVEYENERVLLGVTPGKIDYLCPLPTAIASSEGTFKERLT